MKSVMRFIKEEEGAFMVEYALVTGGIAIACIAATVFLRDALIDWFTEAADTVNLIER